MAFIKCPECGNEVSDMAGICPHCGNPIGQKTTKTKIGIDKILFLVGSALITIAPALPYAREELNLLLNPDVFLYNMWQMLSPEAGGSKSGDGIGIWGIMPTLIVAIGLLGVVLVIIQIVKKTEIKKAIRALVPGGTVALLALFELFALRTYKKSKSIMQNVAKERGLDDLLVSSKGIGFYLLILGVVICIIALFVKNSKKEEENACFMTDEKRICPECGNDVLASDEKCSKCGYPLKHGSESKSISKPDSKKRIVGIALVAVGIIFAFLSYKTRFMGEYDYYAGVIDSYEDSIRDYRDSKQEVTDEANSYNAGFFRNSYKNLASSYQTLIDHAEDRIDEYKGKQTAIVVKALLMLAAALALAGTGGFLIKKNSGRIK